MTVDDVMKRRVELQKVIDSLREVLRGDKMDHLVFKVHILEQFCNVESCSKEEHTQHHQDMSIAVRSLEAAAGRWVEMRAHLAIASNAIQPPKGWTSAVETDVTIN